MEKSYKELILPRIFIMQKWNIQCIRDIIRKTYQKSIGCVADLGCGDGVATMEYVADMNCGRIYGVDIERKLDEEIGKKMEFVRTDLNEKWDLADNSVDVVVSNQTIEHLNNLDNFFRELKRVLKPGGVAVISSVNISSLHSLVLLSLNKYPTMINPFPVNLGNFLYGTEGVGHNWAFNRAIYRDIAKFYDFQLVSLWGSGYYFVPEIVSIILSKLFPFWAVYTGFVIRKK